MQEQTPIKEQTHSAVPPNHERYELEVACSVIVIRICHVIPSAEQHFNLDVMSCFNGGQVLKGCTGSGNLARALNGLKVFPDAIECPRPGGCAAHQACDPRVSRAGRWDTSCQVLVRALIVVAEYCGQSLQQHALGYNLRLEFLHPIGPRAAVTTLEHRDYGFEVDFFFRSWDEHLDHAPEVLP